MTCAHLRLRKLCKACQTLPQFRLFFSFLFWDAWLAMMRILLVRVFIPCLLRRLLCFWLTKRALDSLPGTLLPRVWTFYPPAPGTLSPPWLVLSKQFVKAVCFWSLIFLSLLLCFSILSTQVHLAFAGHIKAFIWGHAQSEISIVPPCYRVSLLHEPFEGPMIWLVQFSLASSFSLVGTARLCPARLSEPSSYDGGLPPARNMISWYFMGLFLSHRRTPVTQSSSIDGFSLTDQPLLGVPWPPSALVAPGGTFEKSAGKKPGQIAMDKENM